MTWSYRKNRLHYWRSIRWYTQKELAKEIGVSPTTVSLNVIAKHLGYTS